MAEIKILENSKNSITGPDNLCKSTKNSSFSLGSTSPKICIKILSGVCSVEVELFILKFLESSFCFFH